MKLDVMERVLAQSLLPEKGSFANLKLVRVAREALSFNEEENKLLNFKQKQDQVKWEDGVIGEIDINLGEVATEMIKKELKSLNGKEELTPQLISLYSKFVEA